MNLKQRVRYLIWAANHLPNANTVCPSCGSRDSKVTKRKFIVTALHCCQDCGLLFRVPKQTAEEANEFYQDAYQSGMTTELPNEHQLERFKETQFIGTKKDYTTYIDVLRALQVEEGKSVFDYGASWGYGTWQFTQAGFRAYGLEISKPRADYARVMLGCMMVDHVEQLPEAVDVFFSAHVIEHLNDPNILWQAATQSLKRDGTLVILMPNGEPKRAKQSKSYHQMWGQLHPLLLSKQSLDDMAERHGFTGVAYSSPYNLEAVKQRSGGELLGPELLYVAWRKK